MNNFSLFCSMVKKASNDFYLGNYINRVKVGDDYFSLIKSPRKILLDLVKDEANMI